MARFDKIEVLKKIGYTGMVPVFYHHDVQSHPEADNRFPAYPRGYLRQGPGSPHHNGYPLRLSQFRHTVGQPRPAMDGGGSGQ